MVGRRVEGFWAAIWTFFDVEASTPYERVLGSREMPGAEWFPGARLNYAEHVFRGKQDSAIALQHASELRELDFMTWGELRDLTARIATGLRFLGVGPGDRVVAYMPNIPEAIAAFLACASIGATWSSCSPDFGARSVVDRFAQIEPKVLIAVDGYRYGGKDFDRRDVVAGLRDEIPSLEHVVLLDYLGADGELPAGTVPWRELIKPAGAAGVRPSCPSTTRCGCCTRRARPGCPSRSSTARAACCSSTSRRCTCISTPRRATASSGSRPPAG